MNTRFLGAYFLAWTLGLLSTASSEYPKHLATVTLVELAQEVGSGAREPALFLPGPSLRWTDSLGPKGLNFRQGKWGSVDPLPEKVPLWAKGVLQLNLKPQSDGLQSSVTSLKNGVLVGATGEFLGWAPSKGFDSEGKPHIVFDRYRNGDFEVVYLDPERKVEYRLGLSSAMEAHATIAVDSLDRIWIAWDEADATWGSAGGLHDSRKLRLVMRDTNGWHEVSLPSQGQLTANSAENHQPLEEFVESPQLAIDGDGTVWLFYRVVVGFKNSRVNANRRNAWMLRAIYLQGSEWSQPVSLPRSDSHSHATLAVLPSKRGGLWGAWTSDYRLQNFGTTRSWSKSFMDSPQLMLAHIERAPIDQKPVVSTPDLTPWEVHFVPIGKADRNDATSDAGDSKYLRLWGDLHRHSDLSRCASNTDGSLLDQYRFAQGPGELDFVAVTDHFQHMSQAAWLYSMDVADRVHVDDAPIPLYGFEYSFPEGHRNVIFAHRDAVSQPTELSREKPEMHSFLNKGVLTIPHQIGDGPVSFASSGFVPDYDRQVEIFQRRGSYEVIGGLRQARKMTPSSNTVRNLLKDQLRFGLIASSDHGYSNGAFAVVLAEEKTRESILAALRQRRSYAATARIELDVQLGDLVMGEQGKVSLSSPLKVSVNSPAPIARVEVIRNGEVAHSWEGNQDDKAGRLTWGLLAVQYGELTDRPDLELRGQGIEFGEPFLMDGESLPDFEAPSPNQWHEVTRLKYLSQRPQAQGGWVVPVHYTTDLEAVQISFGEPEKEVQYSGQELVSGSNWTKTYESKPLSLHLLPRPLGSRTLEGEFQPGDWQAGEWVYIRVIAVDASMAWSSPIWVDQVKGE